MTFTVSLTAPSPPPRPPTPPSPAIEFLYGTIKYSFDSTPAGSQALTNAIPGLVLPCDIPRRNPAPCVVTNINVPANSPSRPNALQFRRGQATGGCITFTDNRGFLGFGTYYAYASTTSSLSLLFYSTVDCSGDASRTLVAQQDLGSTFTTGDNSVLGFARYPASGYLTLPRQARSVYFSLGTASDVWFGEFERRKGAGGCLSGSPLECTVCTPVPATGTTVVPSSYAPLQPGAATPRQKFVPVLRPSHLLNLPRCSPMFGPPQTTSPSSPAPPRHRRPRRPRPSPSWRTPRTRPSSWSLTSRPPATTSPTTC